MPEVKTCGTKKLSSRGAGAWRTAGTLSLQSATADCFSLSLSSESETVSVSVSVTVSVYIAFASFCLDMFCVCLGLLRVCLSLLRVYLDLLHVCLSLLHVCLGLLSICLDLLAMRWNGQCCRCRDATDRVSTSGSTADGIPPHHAGTPPRTSWHGTVRRTASDADGAAMCALQQRRATYRSLHRYLHVLRIFSEFHEDRM